MRVIIAGAGEIGWYIAGEVSADRHDVTIIDDEESRIRQVNSTLDVKAINGSAGSAHVLIKAGVMDADLVVAVTSAPASPWSRRGWRSWPVTSIWIRRWSVPVATSRHWYVGMRVAGWRPDGAMRSWVDQSTTS